MAYPGNRVCREGGSGQTGRVVGSVGPGYKKPGPVTLPDIPADGRPTELPAASPPAFAQTPLRINLRRLVVMPDCPLRHAGLRSGISSMRLRVKPAMTWKVKPAMTWKVKPAMTWKVKPAMTGASSAHAGYFQLLNLMPGSDGPGPLRWWGIWPAVIL